MSARGSWHDAARALAATHTRHQAAEALGVRYGTLKSWATTHGVEFVRARAPAAAPPVEAEEREPEGMDDSERLDLLAQLYAAERRATAYRVTDRRLRALTSRPEPARDVAAALARLGAA